MKKTIALLLPVCLLAACSGKGAEGQASGEAAGADGNVAMAATLPKVKYVSPLPPTKDPAVAKRQQLEIVDAMIHDPRVDLETIQGEAYRRGVTLTPEQIATKKAMPVDRGAAPAPLVSGPTPAASPAAAAAEPAKAPSAS